ncbi:hypothetical protein [Legionella tucsonensis]|uniref:hypothetical protein n=1 Tax=Legionella tucsonensis TaxID=40335 RepID=UPI001056149A|nr:hypothetical protein [Legionella tucsonensis]
MIQKIIFTAYLIIISTSSISASDHCPFSEEEARRDGWKYMDFGGISKDSTIFVSFGKSTTDRVIKFGCIYRSGSRLRKIPEKPFVKPKNGVWIKTTSPDDKDDSFYGYHCDYPNAQDYTWEETDR